MSGIDRPEQTADDGVRTDAKPACVALVPVVPTVHWSRVPDLQLSRRRFRHASDRHRRAGPADPQPAAGNAGRCAGRLRGALAPGPGRRHPNPTNHISPTQEVSGAARPATARSLRQAAVPGTPPPAMVPPVRPRRAPFSAQGDRAERKRSPEPTALEVSQIEVQARGRVSGRFAWTPPRLPSPFRVARATQCPTGNPPAPALRAYCVRCCGGGRPVGARRFPHGEDG